MCAVVDIVRKTNFLSTSIFTGWQITADCPFVNANKENNITAFWCSVMLGTVLLFMKLLNMA